jgi:hypothetical protein
MVHLKIKVAHYYELKLNEDRTFIFAVLYGFERGKNKDVYTLRMYNDKRDFEFPIEESTFERWVKEGRIQELTPEQALMYAI